MLRIRCLITLAALLTGAVMLLAGDAPAWKRIPASQWTDDDARELLADSPWVKTVALQQVRDLSSAERRDSGDWDAGIGHGVGLAGTGVLGSTRAAEAIARAHDHSGLGSVTVQWESALPVRAAETKLGLDTGAAGRDEFYAISVFDIAAPTRWNAANELKGVAFLKLDKKKDLKPARVEIIRHPDGKATVIYLFRRSTEITRKDPALQFVAQVGRLFLAQTFFTEDMQFRGRLEL